MPIRLWKLDQRAEIFCNHAFTIEVAQKNTQRSASIARRRPGNPRRRVLDNETTEHSRRQRRQIVDANALKVGRELTQMIAVLQHRTRTQSLLLGEVHQEPRCLPLERVIGLMRATETNITRNRQVQHLTNGVAHLLAGLLAPGGASAAGTLASP